MRKALTLRDVLNHKGVEKVDVIAHSEGAVNAAIAALLNPEKFRNIIFFGPAGLIGEDDPIRLLKGFVSQGAPKPSLNKIPVSEEQKAVARAEGGEAIEYPEIPITETAKEVGAIAAREAPKYMIQNPLRAFKEGWGLSQVQIDGLIDKLRERGIGSWISAGRSCAPTKIWLKAKKEASTGSRRLFVFSGNRNTRALYVAAKSNVGKNLFKKLIHRAMREKDVTKVNATAAPFQ